MAAWFIKKFLTGRTSRPYGTGGRAYKLTTVIMQRFPKKGAPQKSCPQKKKWWGKRQVCNKGKLETDRRDERPGKKKSVIWSFENAEALAKPQMKKK